MKTKCSSYTWCEANFRVTDLLRNRMHLDSTMMAGLQIGLVLVIRDKPEGQQIALFPEDTTTDYMWDFLETTPCA